MQTKKVQISAFVICFLDCKITISCAAYIKSSLCVENVWGWDLIKEVFSEWSSFKVRRFTAKGVNLFSYMFTLQGVFRNLKFAAGAQFPGVNISCISFLWSKQFTTIFVICYMNFSSTELKPFTLVLRKIIMNISKSLKLYHVHYHR